MGRHSIFERRMTPAERSARADLILTQNLATFRDVIRQSADIHLETGRLLSDQGLRQEAHANLRAAEITMNTIKILDYMLQGKEHRILTPAELMRDNSNFPNPWNTTLSEKATEEVDRQKAYAEKRAALRVITDKQFGHLAKAEKLDVPGFEELAALDPVQGGVELVKEIKPVRDNGNGDGV